MRAIVFAAALLTVFIATPGHTESLDCHVADPTGTPLNIRMEPNGRIVAKARNGELIQVFGGEEKSDRNGKLWYYVALNTSSAPDGYALAAYIRCP
jgi:hypothetical protein